MNITTDITRMSQPARAVVKTTPHARQPLGGGVRHHGRSLGFAGYRPEAIWSKPEVGR